MSSQLSLSGCHSHSLTFTSLCYTVVWQSIFWSHGDVGTIWMSWTHQRYEQFYHSETCKQLHAYIHILSMSFYCEGFMKGQSQGHLLCSLPPEQIQIHSFFGALS